ncbi:MAG: c-type cytochrome [Polyangiales bacterium]
MRAERFWCLAAAALAACSANGIIGPAPGADAEVPRDVAVDRPDAPADDLGDASLDEPAADASEALDASAEDVAADVQDPPPPPLTVTPIAWNAAGAAVGAVQAVAEDGDLVAVFTDRGLRVMVAGAVAASDDSVRGWRAAVTSAAADGTAGRWILGADAMSRVFRVRDRSSLDDVTARLALGMRDIRSAAVVARDAVAFGGDGGFAVLRGASVTAWNDPDFVQIFGGGNRVGALTDVGVKVFDLMTERAVRYNVAGVTGAALSSAGALVVTVGPLLYEQNPRGELSPVYTHASALRGVVVSDANTWLIADGRLAIWDGFRVRTSPEVPLSSSARLIAASGGGVWTLQDGALARYALVVDPEEQRWNRDIRSIFATRCTPCHLPGGTAGIDLSTRCAWAIRRDGIREQVVTRMLMPPPPADMPAPERAAIAAYLDSLSADACGGVRDAGPPMDVPRDTGIDVRTDVPRDTGIDVRTDVPRDTGIDVRTDVPRDTGIDVRTDVPRDTGIDVRTDVPRDTGPVDVRTDVPRDTGPVDAGPATYAQVQAVFTRECTRCHGSSGSLNLGASVSYANLVNVAAAGGSCGTSGMMRVVPRNVNNSLLYRKVAATQPCGSSMPRGGPSLPASDIDLIRRWIAAGAPR